MHKSRGSFTRGSYERRSLRYKQPVRSAMKNRLPITRLAHPPKRTALDLEIDLRVSEVKLTHLQEEINRLKDLKRRMEEAKSNGRIECCRLYYVDLVLYQQHRIMVIEPHCIVVDVN